MSRISKNIFYLNNKLWFLVGLLGLLCFFEIENCNAQDTCSINKIINGTFNGNANNWTLGGSWYYLFNTIRVDAKNTHIASSQDMNLCKNTGKIITFYAKYSGVSTAKVSLTVSLGGVEIAKMRWDNSFQGYDELNGATVSKNGNVFTIELNNYTGATSGNLQFTYNRVETLQSGLLIVDNVEVYEKKPKKPTPKQNELFYCKGETANLTTIQPEPLMGITYEWHTVASNPTNATKVANPNAVTAGIYYLYAKSNCETNCISKSASVMVTENQLPNNTSSSGFKGGNICFGETAKLSYNAEDATFVTPHTIVYKKVGTTNTYTQDINTASPFQFTPGDNPTTAGTHKYELIKITNGNGCVRTSGFGKNKAQIKIKGEVQCLISGNDSICPKKTFTYSAPANMNSYAWSVTGNASIQGASDAQNITILTGNSGANFTLTVVVRNSGGCQKTCTRTISVLDDEKPIFTNPADVSLCVNNIINASYAETTNGNVNTPPDYYEFPANYTDLDITNVSDNCCDTNTIMWTITPTSNGQSLSGTGQPSESIAGKKLWLDVATSNPKASYTEKEYTIKYKVTDCSGNESDEKSTTITIKPRPKITKVN